MRSLANFHWQKAYRHMIFNLCMRQRVRVDDLTINIVIVKSKLTSVFHASVLLLTMNFAVTLSK